MLSGSMGRWHGGVPAHKEVSDEERELRNEIARHRELITEWLVKKQEAGIAITNHRDALRKALKRARRSGFALL